MASQDLVIDYEHQTEHADTSGARAPAAGWIREVSVRDGALAARVEWTEAARKHIEAGEYRYISPVFTHDRQSREVRALWRAALTNAPRLPDIPALARASLKESKMTIDQLLALLGLPADADEAAARARLDECVAEGCRAMLARCAAAAGLPAGTDEAALAAAARIPAQAAQPPSAPDPARWVPKEQYDAAAVQLASLQQAGVAAEVDALTAGGKLAPAQRDWALAYARQDMAGFRRWAATAPVLVRTGAQLPGGPPPESAAKLTDVETAVCRAIGVSEEAYCAARAAIAAAEGDAS